MVRLAPSCKQRGHRTIADDVNKLSPEAGAVFDTAGLGLGKLTRETLHPIGTIVIGVGPRSGPSRAYTSSTIREPQVMSPAFSRCARHPGMVGNQAIHGEMPHFVAQAIEMKGTAFTRSSQVRHGTNG